MQLYFTPLDCTSSPVEVKSLISNTLIQPNVLLCFGLLTLWISSILHLFDFFIPFKSLDEININARAFQMNPLNTHASILSCICSMNVHITHTFYSLYPPNVFLQSSYFDISNFDPEFTEEMVSSSVCWSQEHSIVNASVMEADDAFVGFSYAPPSDDSFQWNLPCEVFRRLNRFVTYFD